MQQLVLSLFRPWPPVTAFASVALIYLALNGLLGTHLTFAVQGIALVTLFLATPVLAVICRRIALPSNRFFAAAVGGVLCATVWVGLITSYFNGGPDFEAHQSMFNILRCGIPSVLLYVPLIWLACGGTRLVEPENGHATAELRTTHGYALGAIIWLLASGALAAVPDTLLTFANWWGPMSLFTGPVAGVICALNAIRAARGAGRIARWVLTIAAVALILRLIYIGGFFILLSGWMH